MFRPGKHFHETIADFLLASMNFAKMRFFQFRRNIGLDAFHNFFRQGCPGCRGKLLRLCKEVINR